MDIGQDGVVAFAHVGGDCADGQLWEAAAQVLEAGNGLQMVVAVGGRIGAGQRPVSEQAVVEDIEGFALVAEIVLAPAGLVGGAGAAGVLGGLGWLAGARATSVWLEPL